MTIRDLGKLIFSTIQDSKGKIQVILQKEETEEKAEADSEGTKSNVLNFPTKSSDPKIN
jgi:lysyl-tRNA synthetase class II